MCRQLVTITASQHLIELSENHASAADAPKWKATIFLRDSFRTQDAIQLFVHPQMPRSKGEGGLDTHRICDRQSRKVTNKIRNKAIA